MNHNIGHPDGIGHQTSNEINRRLFLGLTGVVVANAIVGCVPEEVAGPGLPELEPGQYATEAYFQGQNELWVPNGADGSRPVLAGISNSSGLLFDADKKAYGSAWPIAQLNADWTSSRGASSMKVMSDELLRLNDISGTSPRSRAFLDMITRPYDGAVIPVTPDIATLANPGSSYEQLPDIKAQANETQHQIFNVLLPGLDERAERTGRPVVATLVAPFFMINPESPFFGPDINIAVVLENTATYLEAQVATLGLLNVRVGVNRAYVDYLANLLVTDPVLAATHFAQDNPNIWQHVGPGGTPSFVAECQAIVDDIDSQLAAA